MLVYLRRNETFVRLAAEFGVGVATAHRYVTEAMDLLAELAPDLRQALRIARRKAYVVLDGTLAPIDRCRAQATACTTRASIAAMA